MLFHELLFLMMRPSYFKSRGEPKLSHSFGDSSMSGGCPLRDIPLTLFKKLVGVRSIYKSVNASCIDNAQTLEGVNGTNHAPEGNNTRCSAANDLKTCGVLTNARHARPKESFKSSYHRKGHTRSAGRRMGFRPFYLDITNNIQHKTRAFDGILSET